MAFVLSGRRGFLLSLIFAYLQFTNGGFLNGSVTCIDCSPSYDLSAVRLAVNCSQKEALSYALTDIKGQFQMLISQPNYAEEPDCNINLLGGRTQFCGHQKSITSKIIANNSFNKSSNISYTLQTPLCFFTSCNKIIENVTKYGLGDEKLPERAAAPPSPVGMSITMPPFFLLFRFLPIITIP